MAIADERGLWGHFGVAADHLSDELGWVAYAVGEVPLFLVRKPERAGLPGGAVVTLEVDDLAAMRAHLEQSGCRVEAQGEVGKIITAYDPDGNMIEFSQATKQEEH